MLPSQSWCCWRRWSFAVDGEELTQQEAPTGLGLLALAGRPKALIGCGRSEGEAEHPDGEGRTRVEEDDVAVPLAHHEAHGNETRLCSFEKRENKEDSHVELDDADEHNASLERGAGGRGPRVENDLGWICDKGKQVDGALAGEDVLCVGRDAGGALTGGMHGGNGEGCDAQDHHGDRRNESIHAEEFGCKVKEDVRRKDGGEVRRKFDAK